MSAFSKLPSVSVSGMKEACSSLSHPKLTLAVGALASLLVFKLLYKALSSSSSNSGPEIKFAGEQQFLLGHALAYRNDPVGLLLRQFKEHGKVFRMNFSGFKFILVLDIEAEKKMGAQLETHLSSKQALIDFAFLEGNGPLVRMNGSIVNRFLLNSTMYSDMQTLAINQSESIVRYLVQYFKEHGKQNVDLYEMCRELYLQSAIDQLVGRNLLKYYPDLPKDLTEFQTFSGKRASMGVVLPKWFVRHILLRPVHARREAFLDKLTPVIERMWQEKESTPLKGWVAALHDNEKGHFPGWYGTDQAEKFTSREAAMFVIGIMSSSFGNPALGSAQVLSFVLDHPEARDRLLEELAPLGVHWDDPVYQANLCEFVLKSDTYLEACVLESLRIISNPIGSMRKVMKDDGFWIELSDGTRYHARKGEYVAASHIVPNLLNYEDGDQFKPERQLGPEKPFLITFSLGIHRCPGMRIALLQMKIFVALMLSRFDISVVGGISGLDFRKTGMGRRIDPVVLNLSPKSA